MNQNTAAQPAGPSQPQQQTTPSADRRQSINSSGTTQAPPKPTFVEEIDFYSKKILEHVDVVMRALGHPEQEYKIVTKLEKTVNQGLEQAHWTSYVLIASNGAPVVQGKHFTSNFGFLGSMIELYVATCQRLDEYLDDLGRGQSRNLAHWYF